MSSFGPRRVLLLAIAVTCVLVFAGVQVFRGGEDPPSAPAAAPTPTEVEPAGLDDVDTSATIARAPFCEAIDDASVEAAVGGEVTSRQSYDNGEPVQVGQLSDVSHEYGCRWESDKAVTARAWVFAPPVTVEEARAMVRTAAEDSACIRIQGQYGDPSIGVSCTGKASRQASYRGLFGDSWLTCTLSAPSRMQQARLARRADRWCAAVALESAAQPVTG